MCLNLYSIFDRLSGVYQSPFTAQNEACAQRYFNSVCEQAYTRNDLELYFMGSFDTSNGCINGTKNGAFPEFVCRYEVKVDE